MPTKPKRKLVAKKATRPAAPSKSARSERHLGATEDKVGDRTGSGAGYDEAKTRKPRKGGVASS